MQNISVNKVSSEESKEGQTPKKNNFYLREFNLVVRLGEYGSDSDEESAVGGIVSAVVNPALA